MKKVIQAVVFGIITLSLFNATTANNHSVIHEKISPLKAYIVKYRVGNTNSQRTLHLHSASETEAIAQLKKQNSVPKDANVIILSIKPA